MTYINKQKFLAELGRLLTFMYEEDRQQALGDEHGHGHVAVTVTLEHAVKLFLDIFPNSITVGAQDEAALDAGIVNQLSLGANIGEPLGEVHLHIGYLFYSFFFCHNNTALLSPGPLPRRNNQPDYFTFRRHYCQ